MSSESVCQVAHSWVDMGSFHMCLVVRFMIFTASVRKVWIHPCTHLDLELTLLLLWTLSFWIFFKHLLENGYANFMWFNVSC
jgi:hypothetical protein